MLPAPRGFTVVLGQNGAGKTSLLEAIAYASTQRSFRGAPREALVRHGAERGFVRLEAQTDGRPALVEIEIAPEGRDRVLLNRHRPGRVEELLEALRVTVFSPDDLVLVKGGPAERRAYLDEILVACDPRQLPLRQRVERVLRQRNVLLRQAGGRATPEVLASLDVWDDQLAEGGTELVTRRELLVTSLAPRASAAFERLTRSGTGLRMDYRRSYTGDLADALGATRAEDLRRGVTTVGPHRDELHIRAADLEVRTELSQGRQRCATLALRLAAHGLVAAEAGSLPVLLLDDAFSELDDATASALLEELPDGQAILTTAGRPPAGTDPAAVIRLVDGVLVS